MGTVKFTTLARANIFFKFFTLTLEGKMKSLAFLTLIFLVNTVTSENYACPEYNVNFAGYDVAVVQTDDWRACGNVCSIVSNCAYWTYEIDNGCYHCCWLKSSDDGLYKYDGYISGANGCQYDLTTTDKSIHFQ